jgi:hypothetical protein
MILFLFTLIFIPLFPHYTGIGVAKVNVIGDPVSLTHNVNGSFPICSLVDGAAVVAFTGNVTGTGAAHVLPVEVRVAPVIVWPLGETFQVIL